MKPLYDGTTFGYVGLRDPGLEAMLRQLAAAEFDKDILEMATDCAIQRGRVPKDQRAGLILAGYNLLMYAGQAAPFGVGIETSLTWYRKGGHGFEGYREGFGFEYPDKNAPTDERFQWDMLTPVGVGIEREGMPVLQADVWPEDPTTLFIYRAEAEGSFDFILPTLAVIESAAHSLGFRRVGVQTRVIDNRWGPVQIVDLAQYCLEKNAQETGYQQTDNGNLYKQL
jgi:hypothetical protein